MIKHLVLVLLTVMGVSAEETKTKLRNNIPYAIPMKMLQKNTTDRMNHNLLDILYPFYHRDVRKFLFPPLKKKESINQLDDMSTVASSVPGVLSSACLKFLKCQREYMFDFNRMKIYHSDLPEQSAAACAHLCLRHQPDTRVVMAKLNHLNEQLVCGCDSRREATLNIESGGASGCSPCPDGQHSCGAPGVVSVYLLDRDREECLMPTYSYAGCHRGRVRRSAITLSPWERWPGGCMTHCMASPGDGYVRISRLDNATTLCDCWVSEEGLGPSVTEEVEGCGGKCPDGSGWCGSDESGLTSVFTRSGSLNHHTLQTPLLMYLVLAHYFIHFAAL